MFNLFVTALVEFFGYVMKSSGAILGDFGFDNAIDSGSDVVRRIDVDVDVCVQEHWDRVVS